MHPRAFMFWFGIEEIHIHVLIPRFHSPSFVSSAVEYNELHEIIDSYRNTSKQIHWRRLVPQIHIDSKTMLMNYAIIMKIYRFFVSGLNETKKNQIEPNRAISYTKYCHRNNHDHLECR